MIVMPTKPLDIEAILREVEPTAAYPAAPEGLRIGHVHLRVGNVSEAERFYREAVGLAVTRERGGATFMSSGGYHHHVGANVWHSDRAGMRDPDRAGLSWFSIEAADAKALDDVTARLKAANATVTPIGGAIETQGPSTQAMEVRDPWGTRVRFTRA
jgi:catechol 2,3-dioxygenase